MANLINAPLDETGNLLSDKSLLRNNPTINFSSSSMSSNYDISDVLQINRNALSFRTTLVQNVITNLSASFDFGDALEFTAKRNGVHSFSFYLLQGDINANLPYNVDVQLKVYINGALVETDIINVDLANGNPFQRLAQSFYANEGDLINFKFRVEKDSVGNPNPNVELYFTGFQANYGNVTDYNVPYGYFQFTNNIVYVNSINDLPTAVIDVITLEANKTYYITTTVDLNGARLVGSENTTIIGASSEVSILTSTGLSVGLPLLSSIYTTPIRHISINNVDTAINFDGTTNANEMALDITGVNFVNVPNVGLVKKASNFIFDKGAFLNSKGLSFDGTIGTVALNNSLFSGDGLAGNILEVLATCTITRRFRATYSSIIATGSTIGVNVSVSATIPVESYILDTVNFSGGGTYLGGVTSTDNKAFFVNCKGIANTTEVSQYYMNNNTTTTVIGATNTRVKVLGTTTSATITQKFTNTNNRATYIGSLTRQFLITATVSLESGTNNQIGCYIAKNGVVAPESEVYGTTSGTGRAENITVHTLVELSTNEYIEIFVENATSISNILVTELNVIVK